MGMTAEKLDAVLSHGMSLVQTNHHRSSTGLEFNSSGLGLGLSIVRGIVEAHDGVLHGESRVDVGSVFTIEIPRKHAAESRATA
jgi:signal transduction histidine kinase